MKKLILILIITLSVPLLAQNSISGFITDSQTGESLIGANVYFPKLQTGTSTNSSGYYVITDIPNGTYELIVSYVGYTKKNMTITSNGKNIELDFQLLPEELETEEVVVTGEAEKQIERMYNIPVSKLELTATEVQNVPRFVEADLLRALQSMPGVQSINDFSSGIYVRGGTPDQNLYIVDGTDVYNPEHAFGIFSTFNTEAIKKVDFYKGGYSAEFGGRLSSLVNVNNLDGNRKNFSAVINASVIAANTTIQMPIGNIGSISGSLRRTFLDLVFKSNKDIPDYYFLDGNVKAFFDLGRNDKLTISYFHGYDDLDIGTKNKDMPKIVYDWGNTTGSLNWKHLFGEKLFSSLWVTGSDFNSNFSMKSMGLNEDNGIKDLSIKGALEYYVNPNLNFRFGGEYKKLRQNYNFDESDVKVDVVSDAKLSAAYLNTNWKPDILWDFEFGIRATQFKSDKSFFDIAPRFAVKYRLFENTNLKFSSGIFYQYLHRVPRMFFSSIWTLANQETGRSKSFHLIAGLQHALNEDISFELEAYHKKYFNISQYNPKFGNEIEPTKFQDGKYIFESTNGLFNIGDGRSFGAELLIRKNAGPITGWLSYGYSKTEYKFPKVNNNKYFVPRHDRTHTINFMADYDCTDLINSIFGEDEKNRYKFNVNYTYGTGQPITVANSAYSLNLLPDWESQPSKNAPYQLAPGKINDFRLPAYSRLDISFSMTTTFSWGVFEKYISLVNTLDRENVWFISYADTNEDGKRNNKVEKVNMLPFFPSFGIKLRF